jgi:hypothetical protein
MMEAEIKSAKCPVEFILPFLQRALWRQIK